MNKLLQLAFLILASVTISHAQTITVNWSTTHQTMQGFGAYNGYVNSDMNPYDNLFFNTLGYSLLRITVPLGATSGTSDCDSVQASCATNGDSVTDMQACVAVATHDCKVWASVGNPPAEYNSSGTYQCTVNPALKPTSYGAFGSYISNFIASLNTYQSVPLYAISVQNEPDNTGACQMSAAQIDTFVKTNLGPTMASAGQTSTLIAIPETEDYGDVTSWAGTCMSDPSCANFIGLTMFHNYGGNGLGATPPPYSLPLWETEVQACCGVPTASSTWDPSIADALFWASMLHAEVTSGDASFHYFWYVDNDTTYGTNSQAALINPAQGTPIALRTYAIAQWAKFVRPGWINVGVSYSGSLLVTAFENPGATAGAVVVVNNGSSVSSQQICGGSQLGTSVTPYITDATRTLTAQSPVSVSAGCLTYNIPASSVVTFSTSAAPPTGNVYYISYASGNDSNNGTSTSTPWKHAPGMLGLTPSGSSTGDGCAGNCAAHTPTAGDQFILKGGDVWPNTTAPWLFTWSGTSSSQTYGCAGVGCIYVGNAVGDGLSAWNDGTVTSITLKRDFGGWNPSSAPSVSCSGGGGSSAAATPSVVPTSGNADSGTIGGFIYHIALTNAGSGYTSNPTCSLTGGSGVATLQTDINRPIFDLGSTQGSPPDWPAGQCSSHATTCAPGLFFTGNYIQEYGIEIRNMLIQQPLTNNEDASFLTFLGTNSTGANNYLHGMQVDCFSSSCSAYDVAYMAIYLGGPYDEAANNIIENGDYSFLGNSGQQSNGICTNGTFCQPFEMGIQTSLQANAGPVSVHGNQIWADSWQIRMASSNVSGSNPYLEYGNEIWLVTYLTNPTAHINSRYAQPASGTFNLIAWNNIVHSQVGGTSSQYQCGPGTTYTFYNETQWNIGTGTQSYSLDMADAGNLGGCTLTLYNDTMYENQTSNVCVNSQNGTNVSTITMQNLHCITTPTAANPFWSTGITNSTYKNYAGSLSLGNVQAASTVQSISTATSQGYGPLNAFGPTLSSNDTVTFATGSGTANLTSLCSGYYVSLCSDINGNPRPSSGGWQAGAYLLGTSGSVIIAPSSLSYGSVPQLTTSASQAVTVTNSSGGSITLGSTTFTGTNSGDFTASANTCTGTLTNTSTCTVTIVFHPTAPVGTNETATVNVPFTGFPGTLVSSALSGVSGAPVIGTPICTGACLIAQIPKGMVFR